MRKISRKSKKRACVNCSKKSYWISQHGLCEKCMAAKIRSTHLQIKTKEGPAYERWKKNIIKAADK